VSFTRPDGVAGRKRRAAVLALLASAAALPACGGSEPEPAAAPPASPPAQTEAVTEPPATETDAPPPAPETTEPAPEPEPPPATEEPPPEPLPGLPRFTAGYRDWLKLNEQPIPPNPEGDAHLGTKNVYTTMEADRSGGRLVYPVGTIIVKEAARPETDFIGLVATMRKVEGADPEHGDWVFIEWTRSSPDEPFQETARDEVCWSCRVGAQDTEWVWVHTLGVAR
jgi:Cytochrome P460